MEYTNLGRSGLKISRLALGTMNFGPETEESEAHSIMDSAHEYGINYFDTANVYGGSLGKGSTETILGNWFASGGGRRKRTVLATSQLDAAVRALDVTLDTDALARLDDIFPGRETAPEAYAW